MVVIAIIALLTAIVTSNFAQSKAKARDSKRVSDIAQIQLALELFFDRCNGYPVNLVTTDTISSCPNDQDGNKINLGYFIGKIPTDSATGYTYGIKKGASIPVDYILKAKLETSSSVLQDSVSITDYWTVNGVTISVDCDPSSLNYCVTPK